MFLLLEPSSSPIPSLLPPNSKAPAGLVLDSGEFCKRAFCLSIKQWTNLKGAVNLAICKSFCILPFQRLLGKLKNNAEVTGSWHSYYRWHVYS